MASAAIIAAGALSAAGSVGGAALGQPGTSTPLASAGIASTGFDPGVAFSTFDALLQLGIVDPTVLQQGSPLKRALAEFAVQPLPSAGRRGGQRRLGRLLDKMNELAGDIDAALVAGGPLATADPDKAINALLPEIDIRDRQLLDQLGALAGVSFDELMQQEAAYQAQVAQLVAEAQPVADQVRAGRLAAMGQLGETGDLEAIAATERERLNRMLEERETDVLREANIRGINPGRQLGELEEFRQDADVEALARAVQLVSGRQQVLGGVISPGTVAAQNVAGIRVSGTPGAGGQGSAQQGASQIGQGVAAGTVSMANAMTQAALYNQFQNRPAVDNYINWPYGNYPVGG